MLECCSIKIINMEVEAQRLWNVWLMRRIGSGVLLSFFLFFFGQLIGSGIGAAEKRQEKAARESRGLHNEWI